MNTISFRQIIIVIMLGILLFGDTSKIFKNITNFARKLNIVKVNIKKKSK